MKMTTPPPPPPKKRGRRKGREKSKETKKKKESINRRSYINKINETHIYIFYKYKYWKRKGENLYKFGRIKIKQRLN